MLWNAKLFSSSVESHTQLRQSFTAKSNRESLQPVFVSHKDGCNCTGNVSKAHWNNIWVNLVICLYHLFTVILPPSKSCLALTHRSKRFVSISIKFVFSRIPLFICNKLNKFWITTFYYNPPPPIDMLNIGHCSPQFKLLCLHHLPILQSCWWVSIHLSRGCITTNRLYFCTVVCYWRNRWRLKILKNTRKALKMHWSWVQKWWDGNVPRYSKCYRGPSVLCF